MGDQKAGIHIKLIYFEKTQKIVKYLFLKLLSHFLKHFTAFSEDRVLCSIRWINWNQKLKLKTKIFFVSVNENLMTFLYTLNRGGQENIFLEGEKVFLSSFLKCITNSKCQQQIKFGF